MNEKHQAKLDFLKEINKFKDVKRLTHNPSGSSESDSDHSWHLAMFIITYKNYFVENNYDYTKLLELALIHDLPEIYTGDFLPYHGKTPSNKSELEKKAAKKLFSILPQEENQLFFKMFEEYETQESKEAKMIKILDKFAPFITEMEYFKNSNIASQKTNKITVEMANQFVNKFFFEEDKLPEELFEIIFKESKELNIFYNDK